MGKGNFFYQMQAILNELLILSYQNECDELDREYNGQRISFLLSNTVVKMNKETHNHRKTFFFFE